MEIHPIEAVAITDKVRFLSEPASYPHRPDRVEVIETHLSWVFLAGDLVYKLKKPLQSLHFDFTGLTGRAADCRAEVRLNRRLAARVYRCVVPLVRTNEAKLALGGNGETVDWLVEMVRMPADRMLDRLIEDGAVGPDEVRGLCETLTDFYSGAETVRIAPTAYFGRFVAEQAINREVLAANPGGLPDGYAAVLARLDTALVRFAPLLETRADVVVDGHGDLRPEHVCFAETVLIFDCLEFSDALRMVDPVDEIAFLGLECARLGAAWIGADLMECVTGHLAWPLPDHIAALYTACRAMLRARQALAHLQDPQPRLPEKWRPLADRYVAAADAAMAGLGV